MMANSNNKGIPLNTLILLAISVVTVGSLTMNVQYFKRDVQNNTDQIAEQQAAFAESVKVINDLASRVAVLEATQ